MSLSRLLATLYFPLLISFGASADPCKIYPRILGSSVGTTTIQSIDANLNADRLVATGNTNDASLIGKSVTSSVPFIAMYSI